MSENFYYVEGNSSVKNLVKNLVTEITQNAGIYNWDLIYPTNAIDIKEFSLVKATTSYGKSFYTRLERVSIVAPTASDQLLLDKETYSKAMTDEDLVLLSRHLEAMTMTTVEKDLIKKDESLLTEDEQEQLQLLMVRKNISTDRELYLLRKYYNGESLTSEEQNELDSLIAIHNLSAQELIDWNILKANRKLYSESIILILYKQYVGILLTDSEESLLATYRTSMELTQLEREKLATIKGTMDNRNHIYITIGPDMEDTTRIEIIDDVPTEVPAKDLVEETCGVPARFAWYKDINSEIGDWLPLQYWINVTQDAINMVLRGDPSADNYPYNNYLTSYAYIGAIKPIEDSASTDDEYNFGVTTSSDVQPTFTAKFGERTATGITDLCMIANKIGMPMQPHYPGYYTTHPFMDKCNTEGSRWNHKKHQFSDITLVHPVDMERGKMINVLVGDSSAIYDMDKLVYKKDTVDEENYKKFKITAPYCFLNNSANNLYCIAIRCYKTAE